MTFILRWPAVLALFALVAMCVLAAVSAGAALMGYAAPIAQVQSVQAEAVAAGAGEKTWLDVASGARPRFFFLESPRCVSSAARRAFWVWLLGFAAYAGRWAYEQGQGVVAHFQALSIDLYRDPQALLADPGSFQAQVAILGLILVVGVLIAVIDGADRAYWDKHGR